MTIHGQHLISLRTFLSQIIDYAGLYPPASLSLEAAIRNFVKYQNDPEAWMLSRFIIPAKRLSELSQLAGDTFPHEGVLPFSILGRSGKEMDQFIEYLKFDIADIQAFRELHGSKVVVDMFELTLPTSVFEDQSIVNDVVNKTADALNKNGLTVFFETSFGEGWQVRVEKLFRSLRKIKDKHVGFKLRTGGVTADAFPTAEQVAWAIMSARDSGIPMKATAGLHHPIRHYDQSVQTKMHGFINVFGANVIALSHGLDQDQIQAIVEDEDPSNFIFNEESFSWKNFTASVEQIAQVRSTGCISFGSCSFDEPREDLQKLGLLNP
ncbi:MAG: hypothetical protein H7Y59_15730 [Anaerolineales bacterium]|nr:hypothetical protein [Anaerolineales bacterium]